MNTFRTEWEVRCSLATREYLLVQNELFVEVDRKHLGRIVEVGQGRRDMQQNGHDSSIQGRVELGGLSIRQTQAGEQGILEREQEERVLQERH